MLLRSTLTYAPAVFLTRMSALLLLIIATRLIDQGEYGLLTLVVTIGEMTDAAVTGWLRISLLRLGGKGDVSRSNVRLARSVLVGTTVLALVVAAAASAVVAPERWTAFATAVSVYLAAGAVSRFGLTLLQMQQRHSTYAMLEFLRAVLQLVLPIVAIPLFGTSFLVVSLGTSVATLAAGLVSLHLATSRLVAGPATFTYREFLTLGLPMVVTTLVSFGLTDAERIILKMSHDASAVAIFAAAYALARQPIDTLANAVNMGAFPELVSRFDTEGEQAAATFLTDLMALTLRLCLPTAALLVVLAEEITALVLPASYLDGIVGLFPLIVAGVIAANLTNTVYANVMHVHKRPWLLTAVYGLGSAVGIVLSLLLIPQMAERGAALALLGGSLALLAAGITATRRLTPVPLPYRAIGVALVVALACGLGARLAADAFSAFPLFLRLAAAGLCALAIFLGLNALFHWQEARRLAATFRQRLSRPAT
ncbi:MULTISPECIES: lipopolysaccharide biosynthesis protein [Shinella]|uniref:O-antigen/teichoic acid export membrane protein n=1 Tax=Shinella granuli TaxID=323621 RepID=A0A4R2CHL4_SHIGR|nr:MULTISPECIES: polysaccharide biosynthesis C-terminal domain-containing protein [Shinella]ANH07363.1 hypothetical protein shn_24955 [Shinella sp. HZN7]TCN39923.1 O-antigen/teichoic acid export membrane protein [Shinella granuli]